MKKPTKWCALGISLSSLTQSITQDMNNLSLHPLEISNTSNVTDQNLHLEMALDTTIPVGKRLHALESLRNNPKFVKKAAEIIIRIVQGTQIDNRNRVFAAELLKDIPGFRQEAAQICLDITQKSKVDYPTYLAAALILKSIPEFAQQSTNIFLSIVQDSTIDIQNRLEIAEMLKNTSDFIQSAALAYLNIAQDSSIDCKNRLYAVNILKNMSVFSKEVSDISISIAQDSFGDPKIRLDAANTLKSMPEFTQQAAQAYLSIAQDSDLVFGCYRLDAADALKSMPEFTQQAAQAYLSIAQDPDLFFPLERLNAADALKSMPEFTQQAAQAYLSIAQDPGLSYTWRFNAQNILKDMPDFAQQAEQFYLNVAQDTKAPDMLRLDAAKILLYSHLPNKNKIIEIVKDIFQTCSLEGPFSLENPPIFLEKLQNEVGEDDPIFQDLLACHISCEHQDNPNSPISVYKEMMKKREESVHHFPLKMQIINEETLFSKALMDYPDDQIKAPYTYSPYDIAKMRSSLKDTYKTSKEHMDLFLEDRSIDSVLNVLKKPFFNNFLGRELKSVLDHKFHIILDKIWNEYNEKQDSEKASSLFIQLLMNIQGCETGEKDGVEHTYRLLSQDRIINEKELSTFRLRDEIKKFLTEQFTKEKEKAILNLAEKQTGQGNLQHDTRYIKDIIGNTIGLYPVSEKPSVDWNGNAVSQSIRNLSRQDLLSLFYGYFRPDHLVSLTQDLFNQGRISFSGEAEKNLNWAIITATLNDVTLDGLIDGTDRSSQDYFTWAEDGVTPLGITPAGALKILQMLGFVERVS